MIYLDNAATSRFKPKSVINAVNEGLTLYSANPGRSGHSLSVKASEKVFEARELLNEFFNGYGSEYVSFTSNCTEGLNIAIKGILKKGEHAVITCLEHNSVVRPLEALKEKGFADYSVFNVGETTEQTVENFKKSLKDNTRLCVITAVSNVFGNILPLKELSLEAKKRGIYFFCDGAQGAGVIPIDMKNIGIDCLVVPGHKGLLGPMGTGAILHNNLPFETVIEGGTGTLSFSLKQPPEYPERLESGTLNVPGICGLGAGIKFLKNKGVNNIFTEEFALTNELFSGLCEINGVKLYNSTFDCKINAPVLSFNVKNYHSEEIAQVLNKNLIAVRGGYHCSGLAHSFRGTKEQGTVRVSPCFLNSKKDIKFLLNLIEKICNYKVYMI